MSLSRDPNERVDLRIYLGGKRQGVLHNDPVGIAAYTLFSKVSHFVSKIMDPGDHVKTNSRSNSLIERVTYRLSFDSVRRFSVVGTVGGALDRELSHSLRSLPCSLHWMVS